MISRKTFISVFISGFVLAMVYKLRNIILKYISQFDHSLWDGLLHNHVLMINQGQASQVDYRAFLQKRTELRAYLSQLSAV